MRRGAVVAIAIAVAWATGSEIAAGAPARAPRRPPDCTKVEQKTKKLGRVRQLMAVAQCHHTTGQYRAAWYEYQEAAARARERKDKRTLKQAQRGIQENAGLLVWITVVSDDPTTELDIDGDKTVSGAKMALDPGKHTVHAAGPKRDPWSKTLELLSGDVEEVKVPPAPSSAPTAVAAASGSEAPASAGSSSSSSSSEPSGGAPTEGAAGGAAPVSADRPAESRPERAEAHEPHTGLVADIDALIELYDEVPEGQTDQQSGNAYVFIGNVAYDFTPELRAFMRLGFIDNYAPGRSHAASISNAALGTSYGMYVVPWLRVGAEAGIVLPMGTGGGDSPAAGISGANVRGRALYPTLFDPDYLTPWVGLGAATEGRAVARVDASFNPSFKMRGPDVEDSSKSRFILGVHAGYRVVPQPQIEPFAEIRWFRYVSTPSFVQQDSSLADNLFGGIGVAATFGIVRAQVAWLRALDAPLTRDDFSVVAFRLGADF